MPHEVTFEQELHELLARKLSFEELEPLVVELHRKHDREVPPPIVGTMEAVDPEDKFGE
jgi:hypothetical protein